MVCVSRSDSKSVLLMLAPSIGLPFLLPPLAMDGLRDRSGELWLTGIAGRHLAGVTDELARTVFPRIVERKGAAGVARQRKRPHAGDRQIFVQDADWMVGYDVLWTGNRKSGNRNAAGERF